MRVMIRLIRLVSTDEYDDNDDYRVSTNAPAINTEQEIFKWRQIVPGYSFLKMKN